MGFAISRRYLEVSHRFRREKSLGSEHPTVALTEVGMAKLLLAQGRNTEAETLFEKAMPVLVTT